MAATDAKPVPIKNTAFRLEFDLRLNTGALSSGAAGLDSEVSIDAGAFTDCTNEATEIATSSGSYYLDLTAAEMNGDCIAVHIKSSTANAVTRTIYLYPQEAGDIKVDLQTILGSATAVVNMQLAALSMKTGTIDNTAFTITATEMECSDITDAAADTYKDRLLALTSGGLIRQIARITAYSLVSGRGHFTVTGFTSAPANGVTVEVI